MGLDDGSALSFWSLKGDAKVIAVYLRTSYKGWDLRVRRRGADPDDILDFRVSFPGTAAGAE